MKSDLKPLSMITPQMVVKMHGDQFSYDTARRKLRQVRHHLQVNRNFVTISEYASFYGFDEKTVIESLRH